MNIPRSSSEQDDIANSMTMRALQYLSCSFTTFLTVTVDHVLALSQTKYLNEISSYGDQSTTRNNPSYYYRASPTLPQLL